MILRQLAAPAFVLIIAVSGCVYPVFNNPMTISTKVEAARNARPLKQVSTVQSNCLIVLIPIISDPRDGYDALMQEATAAGGNAVVDVQVRNRSWFWLLPLVFVDRTELVGTAAVIGGGGGSIPKTSSSATSRARKGS